MREAAELAGATSEYSAAPLEDNLFEWHFTVRGPGETEFEGGIYHGRIIVPPEYPMKPPDIILLTASLFCGIAVLMCKLNYDVRFSLMVGLRSVRRSAFPYPVTTPRPGR